MVWLTWRQHRMQLLVTVLLLAGFAGLLFVENRFRLSFVDSDVVKALPAVVPALVGVFWGAPLFAREFEQGTYQTAWTQSVTRTRWLAVKFGLIAVVLAAVGLGFGFAVSQRVAAEPTGMSRLSEVFGVTGVVPAGWFLLAFAIGAASGAVLRRMLPAMAVTIAVFAVLLIGSWLVRGEPQQGAPAPVEGTTVPENAVVLSTNWVSATGAFVDQSRVEDMCGAPEASACMRELGFEQRFLYDPPDPRYWRLQWTELGMLLAGTAVFGGATFLAMSRRREGV